MADPARTPALEPDADDHSASPAPPSTTDDLFTQVDHLVHALAPVRDFLQLLGDCASVNADTITDLAPATLYATLQDLTDQLLDIDRRCASLALCTYRAAAKPEDPAPTLIEAQGNAIYAVRQMLLTAHAVMGCARHDNEGDGWPEFDRDALAGTMHRLAERLANASAALQNAVYRPVTSSTQQPVTTAREASAAAAAPKSAV